MPKLEIVLASPEVREVYRPGTTWLLTGCGEYDAARLDRFGTERDSIEAEICARAGDATVIKVIHRNGEAQRVNAWRGSTSMHEVYQLKSENGDLVIADHFRSVLVRLPTSQRVPSDDAIIDHFLFRATPGHNTYCQKIVCLGHGERTSIDLKSGKSNTTIFQRVDGPSDPGSVSDYLERISQALESVLSPLKQRDDVATLFSGGVDSTLLHCYLGPRTNALNFVLDTKDASAVIEDQYAKTAADWLGVSLHRQEVRKSKFLSDLELATENAAMPIHHGMLVALAQGFSNDYETYISGFNADCLFGPNARFNRLASLFANPFLLKCLEVSSPVIVRKDLARRSIWRERFEDFLTTAERLAVDPESMVGLGAYSATYTEFDVAKAVFGEEAVSRRVEKRFEYLTERVAQKAPQGDRFLRHLEVASWMQSLCRSLHPQLRQLGMANNKSLLLPYYSGNVVQSALSIPVTDRYLRQFEGKYILKKLLKRRLEEYPIGQRKGPTALANFPRYYKAGPLSQVWEYYEVPDFIQGSAKDKIITSPLNITYSAISYAIWKRRVLENERFEALRSERSYEWPHDSARQAGHPRTGQQDDPHGIASHGRERALQRT